LHVVLLDTQYEIRRFPFASASPAFLLPIVHRRLIERTMDWLGKFGLGRVHLVTDRNPAEDFAFSRAVVEHDLHIAASLDEVILRIRRRGEMDQALLVMQANLDPLPDLPAIAAEHFRSGATVSFVKGTCRFGPGQYSHGAPALVLASPVMSRMLARRPVERPLAEIPRLARKKGLKALSVDGGTAVVEVNNPYALYQANLGDLRPDKLGSAGFEQRGDALWVAPGARVEAVQVDPIGGPVVVTRGATVAAGSTLRGPTLIGEHAVVEPGSFVHKGLLLRDSYLPKQSFVANSIVGPTLSQRVAS